MKESKKVLMSDPSILTIIAMPSQEPFIDLVNFDPDIVVDQSLANRSQYFSFVRLSVAKKLSLAKNFLPKDIRFFIKEGYRSLDIQEIAFKRSLQRVKENSPYQDLDYLIAEASKYVAPPNVAPHPTGGAVDLTLIDSDGIELDLGTPFDAIPHETDNATFFDATNISIEAIQNRQILAHALQSVGFVNYYTEWWHWSYGDKYWAVMNDVDEALYNHVTDEDLLDLLQEA
ncbi:M15 family metallopeptidase [Psychrobacillus sp. OK032]|uniref:M15 family metallopeptidase n=1 Tax=Psychrobacillus sp. OK032 TaxID=1884358 RepID=UPI0008B13602|nr:M15 family metallopeptidase [Psychrobacillus sp. OK032]SES45531.1 D-alanyl-D-alanine dipeptidase [Psychrobacillus sp. OK032]